MNDKTIIRETSTVNYKVCVLCATFNHAPYITQTMDGFCIQQTDFPFICVIIDDASQDGAQEAISRYLQEHFNEVTKEETENYNLTLACHKVNANCHFAVFLLKKNHYSQGKMPLDYANRWKEHCSYVALCEGDDYWTDEHKLQKQADALDATPQATLVYSHSPVCMVLKIPSTELLDCTSNADYCRSRSVFHFLQVVQDERI